MKRLLIRVEGSSRPPFRLQIRPATRVSDVLAHLNLTDDYVLSPVSDPQEHFTSDEAIYDLIAHDEKLIAQLSPDAVEKANASIRSFCK